MHTFLIDQINIRCYLKIKVKFSKIKKYIYWEFEYYTVSQVIVSYNSRNMNEFLDVCTKIWNKI